MVSSDSALSEKFGRLYRACGTVCAGKRPYKRLFLLFIFPDYAISVKTSVLCARWFLGCTKGESRTRALPNACFLWHNVDVMVLFHDWRRTESFLRRLSLRVGTHFMDSDVGYVLAFFWPDSFWFTYMASRLILCAHLPTIWQVLSDVDIADFIFLFQL